MLTAMLQLVLAYIYCIQPKLYIYLEYHSSFERIQNRER